MARSRMSVKLDRQTWVILGWVLVFLALALYECGSALFEGEPDFYR
jgi:hypothetical protein